jgi:hypothetical protein
VNIIHIRINEMSAFGDTEYEKNDIVDCIKYYKERHPEMSDKDIILNIMEAVRWGFELYLKGDEK